ncbi:hypothetical protein RND71_015728 [Anisodus tanguticus]|uniref:Uncharacterized protein n=1 Tax=Anisodus tanguticus TaxID=243964 RepID=A0AAE1S6U8_9SOLA|nr:hypothetical protein RND71_015728 [Anisodus tanguticus]
MFVDTCKRIRLMKSSEAFGLGKNVKQGYLEKIFPVLAGGVPRKLAILGSILFLSFVNYTGLTIVGYVGVTLRSSVGEGTTEVFRIIDEFLFDINCKFLNGVVDKHNLYPHALLLTRYKETIFFSTKKKLVEFVVIDNVVNKKLDALTTSKLCVRMNTLQIAKDMDMLAAAN